MCIYEHSLSASGSHVGRSTVDACTSSVEHCVTNNTVSCLHANVSYFSVADNGQINHSPVCCERTLKSAEWGLQLGWHTFLRRLIRTFEFSTAAEQRVWVSGSLAVVMSGKPIIPSFLIADIVSGSTEMWLVSRSDFSGPPATSMRCHAWDPAELQITMQDFTLRVAEQIEACSQRSTVRSVEVLSIEAALFGVLETANVMVSVGVQ